MSERKASLVPGVLLIVIGTWIFLQRFFHLSFYWFRVYPVLLVLFGGFLIYHTFARRRSGGLFCGVVLLILGAFFFLRNFDFIPYFYADEYWPLFLVASGLGFVALFMFDPKEWGVLIPAGFLLFFGVGFSMRTFHGYFWGWDRFVETYWPAVLILIGAAVLVRGFLPKKK